MSVRNKLPWKKKVAAFKKDLRETAKRIRDMYATIKWDTIKPVAVDKEYLAWLTKNYLGKAVKQAMVYGFRQAFHKEAVHLYALKFNAILMDGLLKQTGLDKKARDAVLALRDDYKKVTEFFSGNYFDRLKTDGKKLKRSLKRAGRRFRRAIGRLK